MREVRETTPVKIVVLEPSESDDRSFDPRSNAELGCRRIIVEGEGEGAGVVEEEGKR